MDALRDAIAWAEKSFRYSAGTQRRRFVDALIVAAKAAAQPAQTEPVASLLRAEETISAMGDLCSDYFNDAVARHNAAVDASPAAQPAQIPSDRGEPEETRARMAAPPAALPVEDAALMAEYKRNREYFLQWLAVGTCGALDAEGKYSCRLPYGHSGLHESDGRHWRRWTAAQPIGEMKMDVKAMVDRFFTAEQARAMSEHCLGAQAAQPPKHQHTWEPRWQQSLERGEVRWNECSGCGAKE